MIASQQQHRQSLLTSPRVAWPTLVLFVASLGMWITGIALGAMHLIPAYVAVALCSLGAYASFTPLHEAAHRSIARARWVNEVVGRIAGVPLMGPLGAFRHFHLEHHKHTNDADTDPDHWSGRGPSWLLPFRWLTQDLRYYVLYAKTHHLRPKRERAEVIATLGAFVATAIALLALGHARDVLLFWILPARLATIVLAFAFDWLPHRPHDVLSKVDRFRATSVVGPRTETFSGRLLLVALVGQSLHLVHHLFPGVPFYRYARVWRSGACAPRR